MTNTPYAGARRAGICCTSAALLLVTTAPDAWAQATGGQPATPAPAAQAAAAQPESKTRLEISGFAMLDMGYDFETNDQLWFDVVRPTKLPAFEGEFGEDGRFYSGSGKAVSASGATRPPTWASSGRSSSSSCSARALTLDRRHSGCAMHGASSGSSAPARPGARSWIPTSFRTRSSTGGRTG